MFAASKTAPPAGGTPDPQFNYVTMLLHGDGTNGAQNNTFVDSSSNAFTITRNGNTTQGSFSPYGSNWSNYFGGTGNYLTTATSASGFSFGTGDFTIEFWINSTQTTRCDPVGQDNTFTSTGWWGLIANLSSSGQLQWFENTTSRISATATNWNNGSWNHIAVTRSGNSVRMFVNGTQVGSTYTTSFTYGASSVGVIAGVLSDDKTTGPLTGYISNLRIVKGTALYTSTFTPSTTPLTAISGTSLLTCQANRFFDASTNALAITATGTPSVQRFNPFGTSTAYSTAIIGGSGYFDGTGDSLTTPSNAVFGFGTGNFTAELWFYPLSTTAAVLYDPRTANDQSPSIAWGATVSAKFQVITNQVVITSSSTYSVGQWYHIAVTRSSTTVTLWVNGTSQGTTTNSTNLPTTSVIIGNYLTGGYSANGYLSDVRITKGGALYTTAFTPPSSPLTTTVSSGTVSLLTNMTNGAIYDNAMMNDLETVGNAQISTSVKKYGTGSLYFDGSGDLLTVAPSNLHSATTNFTVEFWLNLASYGGTQVVVAKGIVGDTAGSSWWFEPVSGSMVLYVASGSTYYTVTASSPPTSQWVHFAGVINNGTAYLYMNGVSQGTPVAVGTPNAGTSAPLMIGSDTSLSYPINGYIDDLRITKGYARYTTNFTPPTAAFPNTGPN